MSLVYSLSTHRLQGGLFIDLSLFSASTSVPSFSPSLFSLFFPPSNGWIFLEQCSYYLLCIFEVQITLSQIINFFRNPTSLSTLSASLSVHRNIILMFGTSTAENRLHSDVSPPNSQSNQTLSLLLWNQANYSFQECLQFELLMNQTLDGCPKARKLVLASMRFGKWWTFLAMSVMYEPSDCNYCRSEQTATRLRMFDKNPQSDVFYTINLNKPGK